MVHLLIAVRIDPVGGAPGAGGPPDHRTRSAVQKPPRPHECLVIEAGAEEGGEEPADRAEIEGHGGIGILAEGLESILDLTMVAGVFGWAVAPRPTCTSALPSSTPNPMIPLGRWYLRLRATTRTPFASSAEARVSPFRPP